MDEDKLNKVRKELDGLIEMYTNIRNDDELIKGLSVVSMVSFPDKRGGEHVLDTLCMGSQDNLVSTIGGSIASNQELLESLIETFTIIDRSIDALNMLSGDEVAQA